jgi:hypothetical protein
LNKGQNFISSGLVMFPGLTCCRVVTCGEAVTLHFQHSSPAEWYA